MTLGFSQEIDIAGMKWRTHFKEKILSCFGYRFINYETQIEQWYKPKLHTIRSDNEGKKDLWRIGRFIHFVYGNRTKNRECFHTALCKGVEDIAIIYPPCCGFTVYVFSRELQHAVKLNDDQIQQLAINDGFDSVEDFKNYFHSDFKGKIIHWTDLKYAI